MIDYLYAQNELLMKRVITVSEKELEEVPELENISIRQRNTWALQRERIAEKANQEFIEFQKQLKARVESDARKG